MSEISSDRMGWPRTKIAGEQGNEASRNQTISRLQRVVALGRTSTPALRTNSAAACSRTARVAFSACRADSRAFASCHGRFRETSVRSRRPTRGRSRASRRRGPGRRHRSSPAPLRGRPPGWRGALRPLRTPGGPRSCGFCGREPSGHRRPPTAEAQDAPAPAAKAANRSH